VRKLCLDGVSYGDSRDVQARITGGPRAGTQVSQQQQIATVGSHRARRGVRILSRYLDAYPCRDDGVWTSSIPGNRRSRK